jgi:hypothetical protein
MTIQRAFRSVKTTCFEKSVIKGAPKLAMGILSTEKLTTACLVTDLIESAYIRAMSAVMG